jgi:hypothetical protein
MKTKIERDTGGGCSICKHKPAVNIEDSYWLCGECVKEKFEEYIAALSLIELVCHRWKDA